MKTQSYRLVLLTLIGILMYSCQKDDQSFKEQMSEPTVSQVLESDSLPQIKIGKKLENPYSVANMKRAYESLKEKRALATASSPSSLAALSTEQDIQIEITDYYVKFWIETDEQRNLLITDSLNLSDIPLDVEVLEEGIQFIDEEVEKEEAHWVYTAVTKDYNFRTEITFEILEDLFLIEPSTIEGQEEEETQQGSSQIMTSAIEQNDFLLNLEEESLRMTGNLDPQDGKATTSAHDKVSFFSKRKSKKTPQGYVKVYNTVTGQLEPVVGIKVKTRRWFKWAKGWTNSQGFYRVNRGYRNNVRYTAVFKNTRGFKIWPSTISISSARYRAGGHSKSGYNFNFYTNSVGWRWATVNNATVKYLDYCTQFGIGKPHFNLRIVANGKSGGGAAPMLRRTLNSITIAKVGQFLTAAKFGIPTSLLWVAVRLVVPDIIIKANASQGTDGVFETTFHELGHASHYKKVGNGYWRKYIDKIIDNSLFHASTAPYGTGRGNNHELVGLGEAWGYHIGYFLTIQEFGNNNGELMLNAFENFDPRERPNNTIIGRYGNTNNIGWSGWIPGGVMYDLMDTNTDLVRTDFRDNASGYSIRNIYDA